MPSPRVSVSREAGRTAVRIAAPRSWTMIAFLAFWMIGWAGGEVAVWRALTSGQIRASAYAFVGAWLVLWTLGGAAGVLGLLWAFAGHELLTAGAGALTVRRAAGPIGRTTSYRLEDVRGLRYLPPTPAGGKTRAAPGMLALEHGGRSVRFGAYLGPEDGRKVVDALAPALAAAPRPAT